jgi:hypothetical protein
VRIMEPSQDCIHARNATAPPCALQRPGLATMRKPQERGAGHRRANTLAECRLRRR